jgi:hypothetical protein
MTANRPRRSPAPGRPRPRRTGVKALLIGLVVITVVAVAWPRPSNQTAKTAGDAQNEKVQTPVCTQLQASDAPASGAGDGGSAAPTTTSAGQSDQPIVADCPADDVQASAMLHVSLTDPTVVPAGWRLEESTVILTQNPDGTTDQAFERIWRAPDFDPSKSTCAPKLLLDAVATVPGEPLSPQGKPAITTLRGGAVAYGDGFRNGTCQGPPEVSGVTGVMHWTAAGVVYDLFSFAVPQDQVVSFASSV